MMKIILSPQVKKFFWGDDLTQLNWATHKKYIVQTLLEKGDQDSIQWLFEQANQTEVKEILPTLTLSPKSNNFWKLYLS